MTRYPHIEFPDPPKPAVCFLGSQTLIKEGQKPRLIVTSNIFYTFKADQGKVCLCILSDVSDNRWLHSSRQIQRACLAQETLLIRRSPKYHMAWFQGDRHQYCALEVFLDFI